MRNRELLEKFMKENLDIRYFDVNWLNDWSVELTDVKGHILTLVTFRPEVIWSMIDNVKYLSYRFKKCHCGSEWVIVND